MLYEGHPIYIMYQRKLWNGSTVICTYYYSTLSPFQYREGTPNQGFCVQFESQSQQKWPSVHHKGHKDDVRISPHLPYTSKEDYERPHWQYVSLLVSQHPIFPADRVPQICYCFACTLRVNLGKNDTASAIRGVLLLSTAPPTLLMYIRKETKHFSSNGCLSL